MTDPQTTPAKPWEGSPDPFEALYQHVMAQMPAVTADVAGVKAWAEQEIAAVKAAASAEVAALEQRLTAALAAARAPAAEGVGAGQS